MSIYRKMMLVFVGAAAIVTALVFAITKAADFRTATFLAAIVTCSLYALESFVVDKKKHLGVFCIIAVFIVTVMYLASH